MIFFYLLIIEETKMIDCSVEPKESGEVNQCGVKLRPQDDAYKAAYVKIINSTHYWYRCAIFIHIL